MVTNVCFIPRAMESFKQKDDKYFDTSLIKGDAPQATGRLLSGRLPSKKGTLAGPSGLNALPPESHGPLCHFLQVAVRPSLTIIKFNDLAPTPYGPLLLYLSPSSYVIPHSCILFLYQFSIYFANRP